MKALTYLLSLSFFALISLGSCAQKDKADKKYGKFIENTGDKVVVYYFHNQRRCATCIEVEKISKETVRELYNGKVGYKIFDLGEESGKAAAKKLGIATQSLLIVRADEIINITVDGFRFANSKPEKLKAIIKDQIDSLL